MPTSSPSAASLFDGWPETMILSCLQGHMGTLNANHDGTAAAITVGDFCYGRRVRPHTRYATEKNPEHLRPARLRGLASTPVGFEVVPIDAHIYDRLSLQRWSKDLRGLFDSAEDFERRGLGFAAIHRGAIVAGASAYTVYDGGIEVEADTAPEVRRQGLASACAARLVLACLEQGLYPSWDAHTRVSLALAEKLGYRSAGEYRTYIKVSFGEEL